MNETYYKMTIENLTEEQKDELEMYLKEKNIYIYWVNIQDNSDGYYKDRHVHWNSEY